jgi:hypothetical protein
MLTAMRVYETKGLAEFGKQLSIAKASASKINVQQSADKAKDDD